MKSAAERRCMGGDGKAVRRCLFKIIFNSERKK